MADARFYLFHIKMCIKATVEKARNAIIPGSIAPSPLFTPICCRSKFFAR